MAPAGSLGTPSSLMARCSTVRMLLLYVAAALCPRPGAARSFLEDHGAINSAAFQNDIWNAMGTMMGCGDQFAPEKVTAIETALAPMWRTLPKNEHGLVERRLLRYVVHRHFMKQSSLIVRGFEPTRLVNASHWGVAEILSQQVPAYVEAVLESAHAEQRGFSLQDAVTMAATLEHLIYDSETALLERVYKRERIPLTTSLNQKGIVKVLEKYFVFWMLGDDIEGIEMLLYNRTLLEATIPHWGAVVGLGAGLVQALEFDRRKSPRPRRGRDMWAKRYSFDDAHEVVASITRTFQSFWQSECIAMKQSLVEMDRHGTGRVPLSKFYAVGVDSDWRFGESEAYLRELGALDETSRWHSKQVIISNYIQATSNCIVSTPHYHVCCMNECESFLGDIEVAIGAPVASPSEILALVGNMTSQATLDDDSSPSLEGRLTTQLEQVAATHGGKVPLHGRLFAQWLHYAFPRECQFPHKTGTVATLTPSEFGEDFVAHSEDMKMHASNASAADVPLTVGREELQWMSQWSEEEELIVDYSSELRGSWGTHYYLVMIGGLAALAAGGVHRSRSSARSPREASRLGGHRGDPADRDAMASLKGAHFV